MGTGDILLGVALRWTNIPSRVGVGGVAILSVASCYRNRDKLWPCGPSWLVSDFTYLFAHRGEISKVYSKLTLTVTSLRRTPLQNGHLP